MNIYNYTDEPIQIGNIATHSEYIKLPDDIDIWKVEHDGQRFLPWPPTEPKNVDIYITKISGEYLYEIHETSLPQIGSFLFLFVSFVALAFLVKIIQKLKSS